MATPAVFLWVDFNPTRSCLRIHVNRRLDPWKSIILWISGYQATANLGLRQGQRYNSAVKQLVLDLIPTPAPSLANFVAGQNAEGLAAIRAIVDSSVEETAKIIYLWGAPGSGKSHLISACRGVGFLALDLNATLDAAHRYAIDSVQSLNEESQHALFDLINRQQASTGTLIVSGNVSPRDLALRRDLTSRLGSGLTFQLHPLTDTEKAAALHAHAKSRGFTLREPVVGYLLRHSRRDIRRASARVVRTDAPGTEAEAQQHRDRDKENMKSLE